MKADEQRIAEVRAQIEKRVRREFGVTAESASTQQIYRAAALCVRDEVMDVFAAERERSQQAGDKCLIYLCAEFLIGRALSNNLVNLDLYDTYEAALEQMGYGLGEIEEQEADAGLGNGGLGRLAACFLDSLSTLDLPAMGFGIRYEYGFFRQEIHDGKQVEVPDNWTLGGDGDVWTAQRSDRVFEVKFGGTIDEQWSEDGRLTVNYIGAQSVLAEACDMPIVGYKSKLPATLRLWRARSPQQIDLARFNQGDYAHAVAERELAESISKVLYPEDSHEQGQELRLRQFYFLASATMQSLVETHKLRFGDLHTLPDKLAIQINDTHPTLAIPELIRILIDEEGFTWEEAVDIVHRTFNYTNHTIMPEALEKWPAGTLQRLLPRIYRIIETIDAQFRDRIWQRYPGDSDRVSRMAVIQSGQVHMANLCVLCCGHVNGVSQLHGQILRTTVFRDFYTTWPDRFTGITNGVTQRRWLGVANPGLRKLVDNTIGEGFMKDWRKISELEPYAQKADFRKQFDKIKRQNKQAFADWMLLSRNVKLNPDTIIDAQAKRLHEYKRQLLKALHILALYDDIVEGRMPAGIEDFPATTFIFAAKAAPGYRRAKDIIELINSISMLVAGDERTRDLIPVVFLENYDVTAAQHLVAAADISEQISTAGMEASGTGNMKFMLNGAITLGTMDGANVEIAEQVGPENIFIFGATVDDLERIKSEGTYNPRSIVEGNPRLARVLEHLVDGSLPTADGRRFEDLYHSLIDYDQYYVLNDFASYDERFGDVIRAYQDRDRWLASAITNTAKAGYFSSDRAIEDYNEQIWHL